MKLEVRQLRKKFGDKEVLHDVSFSIESGKALGLLGRNGAGKTTTIRILMDVFRADSGTICLDGKKFHPRDCKIGYLPEERGLYPKKEIAEQLIYLGQLRGLSHRQAKENTLQWMKRLDIQEYTFKRLETLSKGNQQKVQLAQTLICDPDIVILDEPFSGLDPVNAQILKEVVKELIDSGKLVIFSSHQMNYVEEFCEEVVILNRGNIVLSGNLKEIKREYSRERLFISAEDRTPEELGELFRWEFADLLAVEKVKKDSVIVRKTRPDNKLEILNRLVECNVDVEFFGLYEPSLNDIFVEKAGDEA